jgi:hypothetical protein
MVFPNAPSKEVAGYIRETPIITVCAWCVRIGRRPRPLGPVSDGICEEHAREILATVGLTLDRTHGAARPLGIATPTPAKEAA